jgi:FolB domain-containing protein
MDAIHLVLDLSCIVGILPRERVEPQPIVVRLRLELDLEAVGRTGQLEHGVDYASVDAQVRFLAVEGRFRLIESLAQAVLAAVLVAPVARASVQIEKPAVLRAAVPAVELARDRAWAAARGEVLADAPEVQVLRRSLQAGEAVAGEAVFVTEGFGAVAVPFAADHPCTVLVVRRR